MSYCGYLCVPLSLVRYRNVVPLYRVAEKPYGEYSHQTADSGFYTNLRQYPSNVLFSILMLQYSSSRKSPDISVGIYRSVDFVIGHSSNLAFISPRREDICFSRLSISLSRLSIAQMIREEKGNHSSQLVQAHPSEPGAARTPTTGTGQQGISNEKLLESSFSSSFRSAHPGRTTCI